MKSNIERRKEIFKGVLPPKGTKAYRDVIEFLRENDTPEKKQFSKKSWEKVTKSLEAQCLSNCDLITEHSLRNYLTEFNNRAWNYGLRSMPVMFNIMEAFFIYRKPEIYFELIEEENYLISFFDFANFVTSNEFKESKEIIEENLASDIIYNFNVGKDISEIIFKSDAGDDFIVAGVSIIRRGEEVTILMTIGRKKTEDIHLNKDLFIFDSDNLDKSKMLEDAKKTILKEELVYEYLDEEKEYIKVYVACRIDLETMTIDSKYVAEETNLMYKITTNEIDGFLNNNGEFISEEIEKTYKNCLSNIEIYNPIFDAIKLSLYLPYYFNQNEETIIIEDHDTNFKQINSNPISKKKYRDTFGYKCSIKPLYYLDKNNLFTPDKIRLRDDLFKIQSTGYWKKLPIEDVGFDKKGNTVHGKTWVNQSLSWFEASEEDLIVKKATELYSGENAGFIYILRNPAMDDDIFKIGQTRNEVDERVKQLSKTSVPDKFYKAQEWNVKDCLFAEREIHKRLEYFRVDPRREFFKIKYDKAIKIIKEVVNDINRE